MDNTRCEECGFDTWHGYCDECATRIAFAQAEAAGREVVAAVVARADAEAVAKVAEEAAERRATVAHVSPEGRCPRCLSRLGFCTDDCLMSRAAG